MRLPGSLRSLGLPGLLGLVGILFAVIHLAFIGPGLENEREALREQAQVLESRLRSGGREAGPRSVSDELNDFHASFPRSHASTALLWQIHEAAAEQGLGLATGEYRVQRAADQTLMRYTVTLPMTGSYAQIRAFVAAVLSRIPAAAIDDIQLRRDKAVEARIEARVQLSLYLQTASEAP